MKYIVLDSAPLGLLTQRGGLPEADACRHWLAGKMSAGARAIVPEIVDYELRRELVRAGKLASVARLEQFETHAAVEFIPITRSAMLLAADLWAKVRNQGQTTAHPSALDIDVILAAQIIAATFDLSQLVVATSNVRHLSTLLPAELWRNI